MVKMMRVAKCGMVVWVLVMMVMGGMLAGIAVAASEGGAPAQTTPVPQLNLVGGTLSGGAGGAGGVAGGAGGGATGGGGADMRVAQY